MLTKQQFAAMQDHSILEPYATREQIATMVEQTIKYGFNATYVEPCHVKFAKEISGQAKVGTVIGFPFGTNTTKTKIDEALECIELGADTLDMVINYSMLKSGDIDYVRNELKQFVSTVKTKKPSIDVKIIIECCFLTRTEKIQACEAVRDSGADYIKTSTGTGTGGCRIGDIKMMKRICGSKCKIKAAAQIQSIDDAIAYIEAGAELIGENTAVKLLDEWDQYFNE